MRKALALVTTAASFAALAVSAAPASATSVTFTVETNLLGISQPTTEATLTGAALVSLTGSSFTGSLGSTKVQDDRGGVLGWSSKISATTFTNGTTVIPVTAVSVWVPGTIAVTGTVTAASVHTTEATGLALSDTAQTLVTGTLVNGVNSATFNPSLKVAVPSTATAGKYTGTVTQTVS